MRIEVDCGPNDENETITIDGVPYSGPFIVSWGGDDKRTIMCFTKSTCEPFLDARLAELPSGLMQIRLDGLKRTLDAVVLSPQYVRPFSMTSPQRELPRLEVSLWLRAQEWRKPWSMAAFVAEVTSAPAPDGFAWGRSSSWTRTDLDDDQVPRMAVFWQAPDLSSPLILGERVYALLDYAESVVADVETRLYANVNSQSLVAMFEFPTEIRTACEQYLLYFVDFLKDIGLDARADLTHDAGKVLFSVVPADGPEALGLIREALDAYLVLPMAEQFGGSSTFMADVPSQQLVANLQHLHGQIALKNAVIQSKDIAIGALLQANAALAATPLGGEVLHNSLVSFGYSTSRVGLLPSSSTQVMPQPVQPVVPITPDAPVHLAGGMVTLGTFDKGGVKVHLGGVFRWFRERVSAFKAGR